MSSSSDRKVLDKSFTLLAYSSLAVMVFAVCIFLFPIIVNGLGAIFFKATVEHDKFLCENAGYAFTPSIRSEIEAAAKARAPLYEMMRRFEASAEAAKLEAELESERAGALAEIKASSAKILEISKLGAAERVLKTQELAGAVWKKYCESLNAFTDRSLAEGTQFALAKIFDKEISLLPEQVKSAVEEIGSNGKMTFAQRNSMRRNLSETPDLKIREKIEILALKNAAYNTFKSGISELLGPENNLEKEKMKMMRQRYGQTRMDMARDVLERSVNFITVHKLDANGAEISMRVETAEYFKNTPVEKMLVYAERNFDEMMQPHFTAYWGFFFDSPYDANIFGGIWPMILGTFYLTALSMLIAAPLGIVAAIYFSEYAKSGKVVSLLRMCVGTLAGVPSIVFGLFGLAFIINTMKVSESKSVLAGSITLALLILPTIIRSCEEALKAVPQSYREAALGLGAGKWRAVCTVILPAALPAMFTGIIISMGRAAGETAPIIFTAATSTGAALGITEIFTQPTPALPWNIYNICSEHEMANRVVHVQYGMVLTLIGIVLALNFAAIYMRAKLQKKMKS